MEGKNKHVKGWILMALLLLLLLVLGLILGPIFRTNAQKVKPCPQFSFNMVKYGAGQFIVDDDHILRAALVSNGAKQAGGKNVILNKRGRLYSATIHDRHGKAITKSAEIPTTLGRLLMEEYQKR